MGRPSQQHPITDAVMHYLAIAEEHAPDEYPINVRHVASVIETSPMTIYKYGLDKEIHAAQERQADNGTLSAKALQRRTYEDLHRSYRDEIARLETHNEQLRARLDLIEYNIARLPIDPEQLYLPMPKPDRCVAHSGRLRSGDRLL